MEKPTSNEVLRKLLAEEGFTQQVLRDKIAVTEGWEVFTKQVPHSTVFLRDWEIDTLDGSFAKKAKIALREAPPRRMTLREAQRIVRKEMRRKRRAGKTGVRGWESGWAKSFKEARRILWYTMPISKLRHMGWVE